MFIYDLNESHSVIDFSDETPESALQKRLQLIDILSCFVDNYQFTPSYRAGFWDGKKHFYDINPEMNMRIPKGLVESVLDKFEVSKPYTPLSEIPKVDIRDLKPFIKSLNLSFKPYDYQIKAFYIAITQGRKILLSATGSGKSLIIYMIMRWFEQKNLKGMLIVPNVGLVEQMRSDFIDYAKNENDPQEFIDNIVHIIYAGKEKNLNKPITVTTWQSAILMNPQEFKQLDYVLIDEAHLAAGESLTKLIEISENCKYKIGLTGTLPKEYEHRFQLTATLGKSENIVNAQGLIERGLATPVEVLMWYLNYPEEEKKIVKKMKYPQELKYLEEHHQRNLFMAKIGIQVSEKYGNTLMLYNTISHGDFLLKLVLQEKFNISNVFVLEKITPMRVKKMKDENPEKIFTLVPLSLKDKKTLLKYYSEDEINDKFDNLSKYHIYIIKGEIDGEKRNSIRALLEENTDAILIATFQTLSTGVNVKNLHNILLCASTKSYVRVMQTIGRGLRLHISKEKMRLFDFIDDFSKKTKTGKIQNKNYMLKHSDERIEFYFEAGFPIKEKEISIN